MFLLMPESETKELKAPETEKVVMKISLLADQPSGKTLRKTAEILQNRLEYADVDDYTIDCTGPAELTLCFPVQENMDGIRRILSTRGCLEFWPTLYSCDVCDKLPEDESLTGSLRIECSRSALIGTAHYSDTAKINSYLAQPEVRKNLPKGLVPMWTSKPTRDNDQEFELVAIFKDDRNAPIDNDDIEKASAESDYLSGHHVLLSMTKKGTKQWERFTENNIQKQIAIVIDGLVYSCPRVCNTIEGGQAAIAGDFTRNEVDVLAIILRHGPLPTEVMITHEEIMQP